MDDRLRVGDRGEGLLELARWRRLLCNGEKGKAREQERTQYEVRAQAA